MGLREDLRREGSDCPCAQKAFGKLLETDADKQGQANISTQASLSAEFDLRELWPRDFIAGVAKDVFLRGKFAFSDRRYCTHGRILYSLIPYFRRRAFHFMHLRSLLGDYSGHFSSVRASKPVRRSMDNGWEAEKTHDHGNGVAERVYAKNGVN